MNRERRNAIERVKAKKAFYVHFSTYVMVILFLFILNITTSPGYFWFLWPALGWGMGVFGHYTDTFGSPHLGKNWEEKMIEKEMKKQRYRDDYLDIDDRLELRKIEKKPLWKEEDLV